MWKIGVTCPKCRSSNVKIQEDIPQDVSRLKYVCTDCSNKFDIAEARKAEGLPEALVASVTAYSGTILTWTFEAGGKNT